MTAFFVDTFTGTGSLSSHVPDAGTGGVSWEESWPYPSIELVGGYATVASGYGSNRVSLDEGLRGTFTAEFTCVTGSPPSESRAIITFIEFGGVSWTFEVKPVAGLVFLIWQGTDKISGDIVVYEAIDLESVPEANTEYPGTLTIHDGYQQLEFMGRVLTAWVDVETTACAPVLALFIGPGTSIGQISVSENPPGAFLVAPSAEVSGGGGFLGSALICPVPELVATGSVAENYAHVFAPSPTVRATGHDSTGENAFTYVAPVPTLSAYGGAVARLTAPMAGLFATGVVVVVGRASLVAPLGSIEATGRVTVVGRASLTTHSPYGLIGYSGGVCSITLTGKAILLASGTVGAIGRAVLTAPLFELIASGTLQNHGGANLLAPMPFLDSGGVAWLVAPSAQLIATGFAVVTVTYEAYAVNLSHRDPEANDEVTRYTNYPFDQIVRLGANYYGVATDGLYLLGGKLDNAQPIAYTVKTCIDDFKVKEFKNIASGYFGGRIGPDMKVTVFAGEQGDESYDYSTPRGQGAQNHREKFGRGVKNRYYAIGVSGEEELVLDNIELEINKMTRRI